MIILAYMIALVVSATAVALTQGRLRWQRRSFELSEKMQAACRPFSRKFYDSVEIADLPLPVKRYFETALREGQAMIAIVRFTQQGTFRQNEKKDNWQPFQAIQFVTTHPPGFEWDARIRMAPGIYVWVRDAYVLGAGSLRAALLGLITVADLRDTAALASGELMRYLAEAVWYPTALLPSQGVLWQSIDETSARATLSDGTTTVSLDFRFGADGLIAEVWSKSRSRTATESAPWLCRLGTYEKRFGMSIPLLGEVEWELPAGPAPYFKGRLTNIDYEFVSQ
ncbi:DUF6920 family protein [Undibacterium sp. JH2W]|uniref:DUF6920 family protein n=1 Tax=Undibacterium sp. JH2W TaxID=3413037 RepID=UPI003BEFA5AF